MGVRVLGGITAAVGLVMAGGVAAQADPAGTVAVNRVPSLMPRITILGASPAGILYDVERPPYDGGGGKWTYLKPAGLAAYEVSSDYRVLVGDKAYAPYGADGKVRYLMVGSTVERRCDAAPQPATQYRGAHFAAFTSFGWLSDSSQRVAADATGCRVVGEAPGVSSHNLAVSDDKGYVLITGEDANGHMTMEYRSYAAPAQPQPIQTGGRSRYVGSLDLHGDVITWSQLDYDQPGIRDSYVVRSSATGGAAAVTRVEGVRVGATAIVGATTGWVGCDENHANCRAGSIGAGQLPGSHSIASDGSRFLVDTYGSSPGIDAMQVIAADQPRTRVATVGLVPPQTFAVAVGASTVTYVDNQLGMTGQAPRYSLHRRSFTKSGTTVALGSQTSLGEIGPGPVGRDGRRTAYLDKAGDLWLTTDEGVRTRVFDAVTKVAIVQSGGSMPFRLSGHRLVWVKGNYSGEHCEPWGCSPSYDNLRLMMYDVRTGQNADIGSYASQYAVAMWGNYFAYADASNRIFRKDMSSGAVVQVKAAGPRVAGLDVNGTIVGWSTCAGTDNYGNCATSKIGYRIMTTSSIVERTSTHTNFIRLTGGYLVHSTQQTLDDRPLLKAWRLGTPTVTTIGQLESQFGDAHDELVGWYGPDRIAKLAPLAAFSARPRYLGNAIGSASFTPNGDGKADTWTPEFPISKALPVCRITITTGTTVRRVLPCATPVGAARVTWNGRDSAGRLLPKGTYVWTLTGSDADGNLLWWNGSANPIRGTVRIV